MTIEKLMERFEDSRREYEFALANALSATDEAMNEFRKEARKAKVHARYSRICANKIQRELERYLNCNG